ncbi:hypothetical protein GCM10010112_42640 [Actinoplanes lobatus]|uniref:Type IV secretory pathway TraG/TraD family ATPase VirD4 n=1 Tax=Actinoplanes lobatus TaxID=113568 RepID=A0A7W7MEW1_9ACTN|nr:type IV secretory system conjugative DNA transfer family protein [Actinoplanes lobatus]MBB4747692.1 type IV secretory pathway TraG/TraD family ATPase VirD4 [Actinoplanes lobatus]GGN73391.1 hypothetical protein GCM10010112_42640 [Actinoplanes lobatus]GIE39743.1 hypothetical protein Alo02nite_26410 [Actinoplanes lobatus]
MSIASPLPFAVGRGPRVPSAGLELGLSLQGQAIHAPPMLPVTVIGPTGSGKTTRVAAPILADWPGPAVVLSVKADLIGAAYPARRRRGPVWLLDPEDALRAGDEAARFDLTAWIASLADAQDVAAVLLASGGADDVREGRFWSELAQNWTAPILFAGARSGLDIGQIADLAMRDRSAHAERLVAESGDPIAIRMLRSVLDLEIRARTSVMATVCQALRVFNRPGVVRAATGSDFTLDQVLDGTATLAMTLPAFRMRQVAPLFAAVLTMLWSRLQTRAVNEPLLLLIDEAANVPGVADQMLEWVTTGRGLGVQVVTLWHDLAQLTARYGVERSTVVNNSGSLLFLGAGRDPDGREFLDRFAGAALHDRLATTGNVVFREGRCEPLRLRAPV